MFVIVWVFKIILMVIGMLVAVAGLYLAATRPEWTISTAGIKAGTLGLEGGSYPLGILIAVFGGLSAAGGMVFPTPSRRIDWNKTEQQVAQKTENLPPERREAIREEVKAIRESKDRRQEQAVVDLVSDAPQESFATLLRIAEERRAADDVEGAVEMYLRAAAFATFTAPKQAVLAYEEALGLRPNQYAAAFQLSLLKLDEGDVDAAGRLAEQAVKAATDEVEKIYANAALAQVKLAQNDAPGAVLLLREGAKRLRRKVEEEPDDDLTRRRLGELLQRLGGAQAAAGDLSDARKTYEECYAIRRALAEKYRGKDGQYDRELIYALDGMCTVLEGAGDVETALEFAKAAETNAAGLFAVNPAREDLRLETLILSDRCAALLRQSGDLQGALKRLAQTNAAYEDLARKTPDRLAHHTSLKNNLLALSEVREQTGDLETAADDARRALGIAEAVLRKAPRDSSVRMQEIGARRWVSGIESRVGNLDEAMRQCQKALADAQQMEGGAPYELAAIFRTRASLHTLSGNIEGALKDYAAAIEIYAQLHRRDPGLFFAENQQIACRIELAALKARTGQVEEATRIFDNCIAAADQILAANPKSIDAKRNAAWVRYVVGAQLITNGDARGAEKALTDARVQYDELVSLYPRATTERMSLGWVDVSLCEALRVTGKIEESAKIAKLAIDMAEKLTLADPVNAGGQSLHARAIEALAAVESTRGNLQEQLKLFEKSLKIFDELAGRKGAGMQTRRDLSQAEVYVSHPLMYLGRLQDSEEHLNAALKLRRETFEQMTSWETASDVIGVHIAMAGLFDAPATLAKARQNVDAALPLAREWAEKIPVIAYLRNMLALALLRTGDVRLTEGKTSEARAAYEEALAIQRNMLRADPGNVYLVQDIAASLAGIAECGYFAKDYETAAPAYRETEEAYRRVAEVDPENFWNRWNVLLPQFRLAQIEGDVARQWDIAQRFDELQKGGRERVSLNHEWAIDIRKLLAAKAAGAV